MVGSANVAEIDVNGYTCKALLDSGSMISTISELVLRKLNLVLEILSLENFMLFSSVASGDKLPYTGYV